MKWGKVSDSDKDFLALCLKLNEQKVESEF